MSRRRAERGQATVEFLAVLPLAGLAVLVAWQLAVAGQAVWLSGAAARAAARAHAVGLDARSAARAVLPDRLRTGLQVQAREGGEVRVEVPIPSVIGRRRLAGVDAAARFEPQAP